MTEHTGKDGSVTRIFESDKEREEYENTGTYVNNSIFGLYSRLFDYPTSSSIDALGETTTIRFRDYIS